MRITGSKLRRIIRRVLSESQGDDQMSQLVALENEWWDWCSGGNADSYAMGEMANIEDQINDLKSQMGLPIHDQEYGWAYGDGSPPIHPTDLRKQRMNEGRVLSEGEGDGLSDPQVEEAYYELQNMSPSDFAPDADLSFLDKWPYSEARDILADEEAEEYEEYEDDTDEARWAEQEDAMRARQNRGMYESRRRIIREFGEKDHELKQKLANRERMIGIGMDGGTMPFNPNWDYDNKTGMSRKPKPRIGDELSQVAEVAASSPMYEHFECEGSSDPEVMYMKSGGLTVKVEYMAQGSEFDFQFTVIKPKNWKWSKGCDSRDNDIDELLYDLNDFIDEKENG